MHRSSQVDALQESVRSLESEVQRRNDFVAARSDEAHLCAGHIDSAHGYAEAISAQLEAIQGHVHVAALQRLEHAEQAADAVYLLPIDVTGCAIGKIASAAKHRRSERGRSDALH
jgi:hypothetical protein